MIILGIDWGKSKVGMAVAESRLAVPQGVIKYSSEEYLIKKIKETVESYNVERVVVGISEGVSGILAKEFGEKLKERLNIEVVFHDETLSSLDARKLAREANLKRSRRKELEDSFAAAVVLQDYLDSSLA